MNNKSGIEKIIYKFISGECTPDEIDLVVEYFQENKLTNDFPAVEDIKKMLDESFPKLEKTAADRIFLNIINEGGKSDVIYLKPKKIHVQKYIAIAASVVMLLTIGLSYEYGLFNNKKTPTLTGNEITLQLDNGNIQIISDKETTNVTDANGNIVGNQNRNKIVYDVKSNPESLVYNTLKTPYGKRFELQLSDGTTVHLNAGTTLRYPVKFIAGQNRQIYLNGEAFFDVAKDKEHPFVVNADNLNVRVLGTHFNVSNYPEDDLTDVVLVEGAVAMHSADEKFDLNKNTILKPGYKGSFYKGSNKITSKPVNTNIYTSWINGGLVFRNMAFKNIITKLERRYDVTIINQNEKLASEKFNASFKDEPIEKVLSYFNELHGISYSIKNKQIIIK